ncbi:hypothetical protein [Cryptosporidium hominis TU502]|uniref:hypothetical protein n=1 Tax=Cryptosporidium hominis (strain TU502) TaxID=353151 RepID=UPI0000452A4F|nr:hypothetical protein [Cryptosporidium hominis TU502]
MVMAGNLLPPKIYKQGLEILFDIQCVKLDEIRRKKGNSRREKNKEILIEQILVLSNKKVKREI